MIGNLNPPPPTKATIIIILLHDFKIFFSYFVVCVWGPYFILWNSPPTNVSYFIMLFYKFAFHLTHLKSLYFVVHTFCSLIIPRLVNV